MIGPKGIDPKDVFNDNGVFYRNPTHLQEAARALNQSDIVKAIKGSRRKREHEKFVYDGSSFNKGIMPGIIKIKEMTEDELVMFFKNLLRVRPNIFMLRVGLGEYPNVQPTTDRKIVTIGTSTPRLHTETAKYIAEVFADKNLKVVDFIYYIVNTDPGNFRSEASAFVVSAEDYDNSRLFNPFIEIEYVSN